MEEISPTSYCGVLVKGLQYFSVGTFESTASEHSANQIQVVIHIVSWFLLEMSLLGGCFDAASFEEDFLTFASLGVITLSMAKFAMFSLNRNNLHKFIKFIDMEAVSRTNTDVYVKKAIEDIAVTMRNYAFVSILCGLAYTGSSMLSEKLQTERKYWEIFHLYIPYDVIIFERFGVARLIITISSFYHAYGSIFLDVVSISLFTQVGRQFEATADLFKNIPYSENQEEIKVRLKEVLDYHQTIFGYAENLQKMHSAVFLIYLVVNGLLIGFTMVSCVRNLKTAEGSFVVSFSHLSLCGVLSFQLFLYTRCADLTKDRGLSVSEGVYLSDWYLTTPSTRRDLILVLMRAQHPINYSAMKIFPMNMATFSQIMQIAYGAFSMMTNLD